MIGLVQEVFGEVDRTQEDLYKRMKIKLKEIKGKHVVWYSYDKKYSYEGIVVDFSIEEDDFYENIRFIIRTDKYEFLIRKKDYTPEKILFFNTEEEARLFVEVQ